MPITGLPSVGGSSVEGEPRPSTEDVSVGRGGACSAVAGADRTHHVLGEIGQGYELAMRWIMKGRFIIPAPSFINLVCSARSVGECECVRRSGGRGLRR